MFKHESMTEEELAFTINRITDVHIELGATLDDDELFEEATTYLVDYADILQSALIAKRHERWLEERAARKAE